MKTEKIYVKTKDNNLKMLILRPNNQTKPLPCILWIHGGGFSTGTSEQIHFSIGKLLGKKYGEVVVSPEYRKSTEAPYPAAFNDCCEALEYIFNNSEELQIDKNQIIVGGESAGGGLAVAVCLYARDKGKIKIKLQIPLYPMLDCDDTESSKNNYAYVWDTKKNHEAWKLYLGDLYGTNKVPKYASPAKETNYSNLPPCYTYVEDGEPFYSETLEYIDNLKKANIEARVDVFHGKIHSFDALLWTKNSREAIKKLLQFVEPFFR